MRLEVACGDDGDAWASDRIGTGIVISARHVLTAAHVVRCPGLPIVHATLSNGRRVRMVVERDDVMFGEGRDIARLELASAYALGLGIAPPRIAPSNADTGYGGVALASGVAIGTFIGFDEVEVPSAPGDSGAGVYDFCGELVGIATGSVRLVDRAEPVLRYDRVDARWLEGL